MAGEQSHQEESGVRFEPSDVPPLLPLWLGAGLGTFVLLVLAGVTFGYPLADSPAYRGPAAKLPQAPRLQVAPAGDLQQYRAVTAKKVPQNAMDAAIRQTAQQGWGPAK